MLAACEPASAMLVVLSDSRADPASLVVVALPFDPAGLPSPPLPPLPEGPRGDSVRLALALHDSAALLDADFQRSRAAANDAARTLLPLDRYTAAYAKGFAAWSETASAAERTREARDRVRRRVAALRERLGDALSSLEAHPPATRPRATADSAARHFDRAIVESALTDGSATLTLPSGAWWIATTGPGGALQLPATTVELQPGARDTLRLRARD
ncbi:MAG TPA: hypothetical protein VMM77_07785 [Gemmatimonadaceae bacterium]|nr:hypothetical protein [Gemmatimonadaceae bacterium]